MVANGDRPPYNPEYDRLVQAASHAGLDERFQDSIDLARRAIELEPGDFRAYQLLGTSLQDSGRLGESVRAFRQAIALAPTEAPLHTWLGAVLYKARDFRNAFAEFEQGITLAPDEWSARVYLILGLRDLGDWKYAARQARILMQQRPNAPEVLAATGYCLNQQRRWVEAADFLQRALKAGPSSDPASSGPAPLPDPGRATDYVGTCLDLAVSDLILALCKARRAEEAVAAASAYLEINPEDAHAWRRMGEAYQVRASVTDKREDWEDALRAYTHAAVLAPGDYDLLVARGAVNLGLRNRAAAVRLFREAVRSAPDRVGYYGILIRTEIASLEWRAAVSSFARLCIALIRGAFQRPTFRRA